MHNKKTDMNDLDARCDSAALAIYQSHIDHLTACLMKGDFEAFAARIHLPHHIRNINAAFSSRTEDDMRTIFEQVAERLAADGIDQFIRIGTSARFENTSIIVGEHKSEMLRGAVRAIAPFTNRLRLVQTAEGVWKETHSANAVSLKGRNMGLYSSSDEEQAIPDFSPPPES